MTVEARRDVQFYMMKASTPWSATWPMRRSPKPSYEYAGHEGNYSLPNILAGVRASEIAGDIRETAAEATSRPAADRQEPPSAGTRRGGYVTDPYTPDNSGR